MLDPKGNFGIGVSVDDARFETRTNLFRALERHGLEPDQLGVARVVEVGQLLRRRRELF